MAAYLSDFSSTAEWDPRTSSCERVDPGDWIGVGAAYDNVQRIGPMRSKLRYRVQDYDPGQRIVLVSRSGTLDATDEISFTRAEHEASARDTPGTTVTYKARLQLKGIAKVGEPLLRRIMNKLADDGASGMQRRLDELSRTAVG